MTVAIVKVCKWSTHGQLPPEMAGINAFYKGIVNFNPKSLLTFYFSTPFLVNLNGQKLSKMGRSWCCWEYVLLVNILWLATTNLETECKALTLIFVQEKKCKLNLKNGSFLIGFLRSDISSAAWPISGCPEGGWGGTSEMGGLLAPILPPLIMLIVSMVDMETSRLTSAA